MVRFGRITVRLQYGPRGGEDFVSCYGDVMPWLDDDDGYAGAMLRV